MIDLLILVLIILGSFGILTLLCKLIENEIARQRGKTADREEAHFRAGYAIYLFILLVLVPVLWIILRMRA